MKTFWGSGSIAPCILILGALTKHQAMKAYCVSGGTVPRILDLGTRWRWVVSFTFRPLYP